MLGIGGLSRLGQAYVENYYRETVMATGARRVILVHHDDYTAPFGEVRLFPLIADDAVATARWLVEFNEEEAFGAEIELPPFGRPMPLY